jgi:hypothetical protein
VLSWAATQDVVAVPAHWVPGASTEERRQLAALGGLVGGWMRRHNRRRSDLPEEVQTWLAKDITATDEASAAMERIVANGVDAVAGLYASSVSRSGRRRLGTFFTPSPEARWMTTRWHDRYGTPTSVVDVGAGVGVFTTLASQQWAEATVYAVDVNPVTLGLLLLTDGIDTPQVQPILADYLTWSAETFVALPGPRLVIGNPPYTRLQLIPSEERERLHRASGNLCGARASLSALILAATLLRLGPSDGACLLLPAQWLEADYAAPLREWLWAAAHRPVEIHLFDSNLFADAQVDAVCLIVGPAQLGSATFITSVAQSISGTVTTTDTVHNRSGATPQNWRQLTETPERYDAVPADMFPLSDVARVRRGTATGANWFFTISEQQRQERGIPRSDVIPYLQRTRQLRSSTHVHDADLAANDDAARSWLLHVPHGNINDARTAAYLAEGVASGVPATHLASARPVWYDLTAETVTPDVIVSASATTSFTFAVNDAAAAITNNLYGLTWLDSNDSTTQRQVLTWLRSEAGQGALRLQARVQAGGLRKIEVQALRDLLIPADVLHSPVRG